MPTKLTIPAGADYTKVVRYESDVVGFVAISGITQDSSADATDTAAWEAYAALGL